MTKDDASRAGSQGSAGWGAALARLDDGWSAIEQRLAVWVVLTEIFALVAWVALKALASSHEVSGSIVGILFRALAGAFILGGITHWALRGRVPERLHPVAVIAGIVLGMVLAPFLSEVGVAWSSNVVGWLQNASALALIGGPRGLVTRLTLWLALLGASLAASRGKHISVDLATRYLPARFGAPVTMIGWVAAALVCFAASWGFVDSIAVTKFRADAFGPCENAQPSEEGEVAALCETKATARVGRAVEGMRRDLFLLGRQLSLDVSSFPRVMRGEPYESYMTVARWNAWVREGGWSEHYAPEQVERLIVPEDDPTATKMPMITEPGTGEGRNLLIRDLNFVLPFGLLVIGLKFLLRTLRMASGELAFDPDAAHAEEGLAHAHDDVLAGEGGAR